MTTNPEAPIDAPDAFINRELSWLGFARRVIALVESPDLPLLERVKFAGISGMLHDEFFMKRISGLKRQMKERSNKLSLDGRRPAEEFEACRRELVEQVGLLSDLIQTQLLPALEREGLPIVDQAQLGAEPRKKLRRYFQQSVLPILTPLAVDSEHPFPFISNLGLNLAIMLPKGGNSEVRFVRIKVPGNLPRWIAVPGAGFTPLEQVIAANLDLIYPAVRFDKVHLFRVTRGAEGEVERDEESKEIAEDEPGSIVLQVRHELKARRFAGCVRLQVNADMPASLSRWLAAQLELGPHDIYPTQTFLGLSDLLQLDAPDADRLRFPRHAPALHPRLRRLAAEDPTAIFAAIARGDLLLHHPYHSFDASVLRFLQAAAEDPAVLAIKLTLYRTSRESPIVAALAEAARRGKQVAVVVEVTARFDEAPNIAWGKLLEREGVHVAYGVEQLKTHVKLALLVRQEPGGIRRYAHIGTGNYHPGTARAYEDVGILTCDPAICADVAAVFNALTGVTSHPESENLIVAPVAMRRRFNEMIRREIDHVRHGRRAGIDAKMNQLQDPDIIRELYQASRQGVPIRLNVRGLCCVRPGVAGLSETIRVFSVVGRFLEHSRIFRFSNGGDPEYFIGSADWMKRNLSRRVETVLRILDPTLKRELDRILEVYEQDNCSAWDCGPDGVYTRRTPPPGEQRRPAQEIFIQMAEREGELEIDADDAAESEERDLSPAAARAGRRAQLAAAAARGRTETV